MDSVLPCVTSFSQKQSAGFPAEVKRLHAVGGLRSLLNIFTTQNTCFLMTGTPQESAILAMSSMRTCITSSDGAMAVILMNCTAVASFVMSCMP